MKPKMLSRVNYTTQGGKTLLAIVTGVNADGTATLLVKDDKRSSQTNVKFSEKPAALCWSELQE